MAVGDGTLAGVYWDVGEAHWGIDGRRERKSSTSSSSRLSGRIHLLRWIRPRCNRIASSRCRRKNRCNSGVEQQIIVAPISAGSNCTGRHQTEEWVIPITDLDNFYIETSGGYTKGQIHLGGMGLGDEVEVVAVVKYSEGDLLGESKLCVHRTQSTDGSSRSGLRLEVSPSIQEQRDDVLIDCVTDTTSTGRRAGAGIRHHRHFPSLPQSSRLSLHRRPSLHHSHRCVSPKHVQLYRHYQLERCDPTSQPRRNRTDQTCHDERAHRLERTRQRIQH